MKNSLFKIYSYESLESTNITARELAIGGAGHGTIVLANSQTAGRGRFGRSFFSPKGGIYMSMILQKSNLQNPDLVTVFAAVCVCEAIEKLTNKKPQIKWVNDILLENKKICGISCEILPDLSVIEPAQKLILGIGVNFTAFDLPDDIKQSAGSLFAFNETPNITKDQLISEIASGILSDQHDIIQKYRQRLMLLGRRVIVYGNDEPFEADVLDINDMGHLIVRIAHIDHMSQLDQIDNLDQVNIRILSSGDVRVRLD